MDRTDTAVDVLPNAQSVATGLAARLRDHLITVLAEQGRADVALTGGSIAAKAYEQLAALDTSALDWTRVHLWWGDERFVPLDDPDRNDAAARTALGAIWDHAVTHPMPAPDPGADADAELDAAAQRYADELGDTVFDVVLLGVGPDGHVASVFPGHPSSRATGAVIPVRDSPKPPPLRTSLTLDTINTAQQVWLTVTGPEKADAVAQALGDAPADLPCANVHGRQATNWLLDTDAAAQLPDRRNPNAG